MVRVSTTWNIVLLLSIGAFLSFVYFLESSPRTVWNVRAYNRISPRNRLSPHADAHRKPTIPHIIHQAWNSYQVPQELTDWIQSWKLYNPTWEYWLWTPDDVRALLARRYPEYLDLFNSYYYNIFRFDAMRYFLMDTYGGFYFDIDMECLQPLNVWSYEHQCLLSHETYEHPYLLFNKTSPNVMTTMMGCRRGHPFFKQVISTLAGSFEQYPTDVLDGTGPFFLDRNFRQYNRTGYGILTPRPELDAMRDPDTISVVPPNVFLPTYDPIMKDGFRQKCKNHKSLHNPQASITCEKLQERNFKNVPREDAYTNHLWVHMFLSEDKWAHKRTVPIDEIVPSVKTYMIDGPP